MDAGRRSRVQGPAPQALMHDMGQSPAQGLSDDVVVPFPRRKAKASTDELAALLASLDIRDIGPNDYRGTGCTTAVETLLSRLA
jgi:hypothetical protein